VLANFRQPLLSDLGPAIIREELDHFLVGGHGRFGLVQLLVQPVRLVDQQEGGLVHLLLDLDRAPEAFAYSERSRARGFLDLLANRQLDVGGAGDQSLLDRVRAHKQAVVQLGERVRRAEGEELVAAEQELSRIKAELKQSLEQLRSRNPDLTDFVEVRPVEAEIGRAHV